MAKPENTAEIGLTQKQRLKVAAGILAVTVLVAAPKIQDTLVEAGHEALVEYCQERHPLLVPLINLGEVHETMSPYSPNPAAGSVIKKMVKEDLETYLNSSERSNRIANRVRGFAAEMVKQANAGDGQYEFVPEGSGQTTLKDYQGFGTLYKNMEAPYVYGKGVAVAQATSDNIYRYKDGRYYPHPEPYHLSVSYHQSGAEFWAPQGLDLGRCASVPENGATQGWRVLYDEGGEVPLSTIRWMGSTYDYIDGTYNYSYDSFSNIHKIDNHALAMLQMNEPSSTW